MLPDKFLFGSAIGLDIVKRGTCRPIRLVTGHTRGTGGYIRCTSCRYRNGEVIDGRIPTGDGPGAVKLPTPVTECPGEFNSI